MEDEREEKQNYLRAEILEKNFDADEFLQFLVSKKGEDAADLDLWTFDELKKVVNEFIKNQNNNTQQEAQQENKIKYESDEESEVNKQKTSDKIEEVKFNKSQSSIKSPEIQNEDIPQNVKVENFEEILKCEKLEITELAKYPKIEISLSFPEKHSGGFFSKAYITYLLTTNPVGYKVRRRYSDFEWLRNILQSLYPGLMIPPISKKNYGDRFNEVFISKRMRFLEKFMDSLASNPVIKNSQIFFDFLNLEKEADFVNKKKDYAKIKIPVKLSEMKSIEGELKSKVSKEHENTAESIKNYINLNEIIFKKLCGAHKNLFTEMNQVSLRMKEISDLYSQLNFISEKSNDNTTVTDTYRMLSKLMNDWGEAEKKQAILIDVELKEYFRYIKNEFVSFKDNISKMEMHKSAYYKAESRLLMKKEEYFKQGNITRWEIPQEDLKKLDKNELLKNKDLAFKYMMQKETHHVHSLKENYGYFSFQLLSEFNRIRNLNGLRHKTYVVRVSQNHSDILADLHVMWADLLSYYSDVYDSNTKNI